MRVVHVVPNVSEEASGPAYSVPSLARALGRGGDDVALLSVLGRPLPAAPGFTHHVYPRALILPRLWRSPALARALAREAQRADVVHSHSLWVMPNIYPGWVARPAATRLVVSPRGTLSPWALNHSRYKKKLVWALLQGRVVRAAACLHATAEDEYRDLRALGLRQPVCIIPNGVDVPARAARDEETEVASAPRMLLYIGRLHVKKGIDRLLRAWTALAPTRPDWCLWIVGPDDGGHERELRELAASLRTPRVTFAGPVYGDAKRQLYRRAAIHVLPSHSENFGMTVAESLASGTPVIATRATPWSGLEREACGYWIELGVEPLLAALREATSRGRVELSSLGARGRAWMERDFSWDRVGREMAAVYPGCTPEARCRRACASTERASRRRLCVRAADGVNLRQGCPLRAYRAKALPARPRPPRGPRRWRARACSPSAPPVPIAAATPACIASARSSRSAPRSR
ncbi:MAG TPA: glycosyltransferase [Polyangiaceae bacterium]|nr:glycosyltransferase [Polyangiaceae bacterium]